jgi:CO/xanthine dehydrogenase FAD-binding subunit
VPRTARPTTLAEAFDALAERPAAHLLAGGTDFMVEVNFGRRRPTSVVALRRVAELHGYDVRPGEVVIGAGTTWTTVERELADVLPALAAAARTVGSPQMRNVATIGGNLGTGSPAGDGLPVLAALDATVVIAHGEGGRELPMSQFVTGVKRTALRAGEIITAVRVPRLDGPQFFLKVGTRNAMVISICCAALAVDRASRTVRIGLGAVAPTPVRAPDAEAYIREQVDWATLTAPAAAVRRFGELVGQSVRPITDHRGTAEYRTHAVRLIATRALERSLAS